MGKRGFGKIVRKKVKKVWKAWKMVEKREKKRENPWNSKNRYESTNSKNSLCIFEKNSWLNLCCFYRILDSIFFPFYFDVDLFSFHGLEPNYDVCMLSLYLWFVNFVISVSVLIRIGMCVRGCCERLWTFVFFFLQLHNEWCLPRSVYWTVNVRV